jgi:hypothetical protein
LRAALDRDLVVHALSVAGTILPGALDMEEHSRSEITI